MTASPSILRSYILNEKGCLNSKIVKKVKMSCKVSSKYQITLPKTIREALGLKAGDRLYVSREGDEIILKVIPRVERPSEALYGSAKGDRDAVEAVRAFREGGGGRT